MSESMSRRGSSIRLLASTLALGLAVACSVDTGTLTAKRDVLGASPAPESPKPSGSAGTGLGGSVGGEGAGTHNTSGSASASPSAGTTPGTATGSQTTTAASAGPTPTPRPTPTQYSAYSVEVSVDPEAATIHLAAPDGESTAKYPTTKQFKAKVLLSNNQTNSLVTWKSDDESIATVDALGLVTAGTKTGTAVITATSLDGYETGTCRVIVKDDAALDVTID